MSHILVVEDDAGIREITELALQSAGHEVSVAVSGPDALARVAEERIDLILLDVRMPGMDGAEFARRYRESEAHPAPIIVLTAARDTTLARQELAAARYVEKPFDLDELLSAIDEVTRAAAD